MSKHLKAAIDFGRALIETGDLDPVYIAIVNGIPDWNQRARLVLAYSCLYHLGASAYISELKGRSFFDRLQAAAVNKDRSWPRGTERRHWRANNAMCTMDYFWEKSARELWDVYYKGPERLVKYWCEGKTFAEVSRRVQEIPSFGPWIAFKLVDMAERVLDTHIDLKGCDLNFYEEPRKGAAMIALDDPEAIIHPRAVQKACQKVLRALKDLKAPPNGDRALGIMEAETILCKYKAMVNGHYWVGRDIKEVRYALTDERWGKTAKRLLGAMPKEVTR